jgi:hypothetical protein
MKRLVQTVAAAGLAITALAAAPARASSDHPAPPTRTAYVPPAPMRAPYRQAALRDLRHDYARLEAERERFYAMWRGNPGAQRRFERWYTAERAELDARRYRLGAVAWR